MANPGFAAYSSTAVADSAATGVSAALRELVDDRTLRLLERRRNAPRIPRRGWLVRRALLCADLVGLISAFIVAEALSGGHGPGNRLSDLGEVAFFVVSLPGWVVVAKLYGLYERDEERADHTTVEDLVGVFHLVTVGVWLFFGFARLTHLVDPNVGKLFTFWLIGIVAVPATRVAARTFCHRHVAYLQNTLIVGAGDVGQLIARKLLQHPEYGINLVGFIDDNPKERRTDLEWLALLGGTEKLSEAVRELDVERVIFAFSDKMAEETLELVRIVEKLSVQIDIVPRLFEIVTPTAELHLVEGVPLLSLRVVSPSRSNLAIKRAFDLLIAIPAVILSAPLFAVLAWQIKRCSPGPVFFRQTRLGMDMREFTLLKFRTMYVDTDSSAHQEYVKRAMRGGVAPEANGLFKLQQDGAVTSIGRWLRKTSLDELPQLINVIRGDMSLVGPRPCLPYEVEVFSASHMDRFKVPAGITGLWQVMARARSTFGEALDMDVAYARGWSLGLDLRLLLRTPLHLLRPKATV